MFGKLIKYELRYLLRIFIPMWIAVLAMCGLARVAAWNLVNTSEIVLTIVFLAVYMAFLAVFVVTEVVIVVRFYKGMYGDEGYLMFTLPVTNGQLLHSKALSATLVSMGTMVVASLCGGILLSYPEIREVFSLMLAEADVMFGFNGLQIALLVFWIIVAAIVGAMSGVYAVYLAISIGQLWRKHPIIGAILAYYGMSVLLSGILQAALLPTLMSEAVWLEAEWLMNLQPVTIIVGILVMICVLNALMILICSLITKLLMDKRLNIA